MPAASTNASVFTTQLGGIISPIALSVHEFQSEQSRVHPERVLRRLKIDSRSRHIDALLGPELILERGFDVGMDQELHSRRIAIASGPQRREERRAACQR